MIEFKMPSFIPGLDLNRKFFQQVVKPLMDKNFPDIKYAAGLVGEGSDNLGFDTPRSMDHNWGPHLKFFLSEKDFKVKKDEINRMFRTELPYDFMGFPTNFTKPAQTYLVQQMKPIEKGEVNHMIEFYTIKSFFEHYLGLDPYKKLSSADWLVFPQQALIEVTDGEIFFDSLGIEEVRKKFAYYPDQVWLYIYAMQWGYIANEEAFMGRSGEVGDELGSNIIATNLVTMIMKLCFLMEKKYIPYIKWFGSEFSRLKSATELTHLLLDVVHGKNWGEREESLGKVYETIARMHNDLKLTSAIDTEATEFEGRPYKVLHAMEIYKSVYDKVEEPLLKNTKYKLGSIDQFVSHQRLSHVDYVYWQFKNILSKSQTKK